MKSILLKSILQFSMIMGTGCAVEAHREPLVPSFHHHMTVLNPSHISYQYKAENSLYVGANLSVFPVWKDSKDCVSLGIIEAKIGQNLSITKDSDCTFFIGSGYMRNMEETESYTVVAQVKGAEPTIEKTIHRHPGIAYGTIGFMYGYDFNDMFSVGVNAKAIVGGIAEKDYEMKKVVHFGGEAGLPLTLRFAKMRNWNFEFEPFVNMVKTSEEEAQPLYGAKTSFGYAF